MKKGSKHTVESITLMEKSQRMRFRLNPVGEDTRKKMREVERPPVTQITKDKLKISSRLREKLYCPHCGRCCDPGNSAQWHFDNCRI